MAMYYQGSSEIQADGLQTLYLMNPNYSGYSEAQQQPANMVLLNYATRNTANLPSSQTQHLVGVPLQSNVAATFGSGNSHDLKINHLSINSSHEVSAPRDGNSHFHHSLWGSLDQTGGAGNTSQQQIPSGVVAGNPSGGTTDFATHLGFHRPLVSPTQQGLSLSLSSQQSGFRSLPMDQSISVQTPVGILSPRSGDNLRGSGGSSSSVSAVSNGLPGLQSAVFGSKYLKAAQRLLDELVNVGKGTKTDTMEKAKEKGKMNRESTVLTGEASQLGQNDNKGVTELTAAQRQEIQMKKAKLVSMLDEVEQRYRQYHHQMQIVVASFEQAAGIGSAKSYSQLALQTISKQFRCLKDAISSQIKAASKCLGEEESLGGKFEGSRLKFVDQQLRQQRALQQLGMMQNNTWRPQRGLPERAVSVLRAWLFEHFLHPYPKDSDKQMLAKQTGLTRSQVSNWFINARVRLWKPMVEEMYMEETKNQEQDGSESNKEVGSNSSTPKENTVGRIDHRNILQSKQEKRIIQDATPAEISTSSLKTSTAGNSPQGRGSFGLIGALNMEGNVVEKNSKKMRTEMQNSPSSILSVDMDMKFGETRKGFNHNFNTSHGNGFGTYAIGELGQFNPEQFTTGFHGNSVSLTLGLPPSENLPLSGSHQQNYLQDQNLELEDRLEMGTIESHYDRVNKSQTSHSSMGYENINFDNRKRDAVVAARILNATLVVPKLDKKSFWKDSSNFSEIFNVDWFISYLAKDVKIIKELPLRRGQEWIPYRMRVPRKCSERCYITRVLPVLSKKQAVQLSKFDYRLSNKLETDYQKLRCRVNYHALKFTDPIRIMGEKLVQQMRMRSKHFVALHLRFEPDMLAFSGCYYGGGEKERKELGKIRKRWKTLHISNPDKVRRQGRCPLTPEEVGLMLKALGYGRDVHIYVASGEVYGGEETLAPLKALFPNFYSKDSLASKEELEPFSAFSSRMAALDFIVCDESDVFVTNNNGNMAKILAGRRRYFGHKPTIRPNAKKLYRLFLNRDNMTWEEFTSKVRTFQRGFMGEPKEVRPGRGEFHENPSVCICEDSEAKAKVDSHPRKFGKENVVKKEDDGTVADDENIDEEPEWSDHEDDEDLSELRTKVLPNGTSLDYEVSLSEEPELDELLSD